MNQMKWLVLCLIGLCGMVGAHPTVAQHRNLGILNLPAPPLGVTEWMNLPEGKTSLNISELRGKVIYLYAFQNW